MYLELDVIFFKEDIFHIMKKNAIAVSLALAGLICLASCGDGKEISRADAEKSAKAIETKEESKDFSWPTKVTITAEGEEKSSGKSTMVARYDLDNHYIYFKSTTVTNATSSASATNEEAVTLMYLDGTKFVTKITLAGSTTNNSLDLKSDSAAVAAWDAAGKSVINAVQVTFQGIAKEAVDALTTLDEEESSSSSSAAAASSASDSASSSAAAASAEIKYTEKYYTKGDGNLTIEVTGEATSTYSSVTSKSTSKAKFVFDNYMPVSFTNTASGTLNGEDTTSNSSIVISWNTCDTSVK
jgi:hypothetical protein